MKFLALFFCCSCAAMTVTSALMTWQLVHRAGELARELGVARSEVSDWKLKASAISNLYNKSTDDFLVCLSMLPKTQRDSLNGASQTFGSGRIIGGGK